MQKSFVLLLFFICSIFAAFKLNNTERIGGTQLNGNGCVCHTTVESPNVHVWIEGPDTMVQGQSALYKMKMFGGPAIAGGYNVAVHFGLLNLLDTLSLLIDNELTQSIPLPFASTSDTIFWEFLYTAPDSILMDTLYSVGLSTNWDTIPDERDLWAYGSKFLVRVIENVVPVELISFSAELAGNEVMLTWSTASEKNNLGFEVEKSQKSKVKSQKWERVGFVEGKGTSSNTYYYTFTDNYLPNEKLEYRLKQIDFDGSFTYSKIISIENVSTVKRFSLEQNYPNPFNPNTKISWQSPVSRHHTLKIYDALGNEVATLLDEFREAGFYEIVFQPEARSKQLATGIYYYQLMVGTFVETKKMIYLR